MKVDYMEYARKCDKCQQFSLVLKAHPDELISMTNPWSFIVWRINLIGRLPKVWGSVQYAIVIVDYFTK